MPEREQQVAPKDAQKKPAEFTLKNEEGLRELGFTDYEIAGGRRLEVARKLLFEKPRSQGELQALRQWLGVKRTDPVARKFQHLLEQAAALRRIVKPETREQAGAYLQRALAVRAEAGPSGELLFSLGQVLMGNELVQPESWVKNILDSLRQDEIIGRVAVKPLDAITSPKITLATRQEWWNLRFVGAVESAKSRLKRQKSSEEKADEKDEKEPQEGESGQSPPEDSDRYEPGGGTEGEEKKEKPEGSADFVVTPGKKDFYGSTSYQQWDGKEWKRLLADTGTYNRKPKKGGEMATVNGRTGSKRRAIPLRHGEMVTKKALDALKGKKFLIATNVLGQVFISAPPGQNEVSFAAEVVDAEPIQLKSWYANQVKKPDISLTPPMVREELERIQSQTPTVVEKSRLWMEFCRRHLTYTKEAKWNDSYKQAPDYFSAVSAGRLAKCDVANTFFLLGCAQMGIDGELVGGYAVKKLDGVDAKLTPDDLHSVSRIYDPETKQLVVFDATPPDPNQKEEGRRKKEEGEGEDGGERTPVDELEEDIPGEQELRKMEREITAREKAEREAAARKVEVEEFARDAGCSEQEAQEVLDEIREAMNMTGDGDSRIVDRLLDQFKQLIQELTIPRSTAMPSVPRSMGEELVSPVEAYVAARAGSLDPTGFSRTREIEEKIKHYGGFRLVIVNDRSGSTGRPIYVKDASEPTKRRASTTIKEERRVNLLVLEALSLFQKLSRQQQSTMAPPPLNIETQILGFPGDNYKPVTVIKPLSPELTNKDRLATHRAMSTSGGDNYDEEALALIREQLTPEDRKRLKEKDLLMIVIINGDGGVNNPAAVQRELGLLTEMGVIVRGRGLGENLNEIVDTYAPYGSCGDIDTYPEFVGQEIIEAVKRLAPRRVGRVS